jgi:3-hydroxy-3-methylglutaryl CoA synthase/uncharacterized OB-fold protein
MPTGISSWGAYLPRARLSRAAVAQALAWTSPGSGKAPRGERSYCHWDEDSLTMAVDAARDALESLGGTAVATLQFASTTPPFADRSNAGVIAAALALPDTARAQDVSGSQRAATGALLTALDATGGGARLVIGSDRRAARPGSPQELAFGHGAAALCIDDRALAAEFLGAESLQVDLVDHYRASGSAFDYTLEERWLRDEGHLELVPQAIARLLTRLDLAAADIRHFVFPATTAAAQRIARAAGIAMEAVRDGLTDRCGDIGTGHALLLLGAVLEAAAPGELVLVIGFGQGVDALLFRTSETLAQARPKRGVAGSLAAGVTDDAYVRYLSHTGGLELDWGMRAERDNRTAQSAFYRRQRDLTGFFGGRCTRCGTVQFPRSRACVNPDCRSFDTQDEYRLADEPGSVKSFTEDWLAYSPSPPFIYGNVAFASGGNLFAEFTDTAAGEVAIGAAVRFVFRIKDQDRLRGFRRYFWKATLARQD